MGATATAAAAKWTIVLPLLLLLLYNYLELATSSNSQQQDEELKMKLLQNETDGLLNLRNSTLQKVEVNWTRGTHTCNWTGVQCDENSGHVTNLSLPGKSFIGSIPENSIGLLTKLERLSLTSNGFSGGIPSDFKNLEQLRNLNLGNNNFSGKFPPEITQLKNLRVIDISGNRFFGNISSDFSNLPNLRTLYLSNNEFTGQFPPSITRLKRLNIIDISRNRFYGKIPCGLQSIPKLKVLRLEHNNFTGKLPGLHIDKSVNFSAAHNNIFGAVPNTLSHLGKDAFLGNPSLCGRPLADCDMRNRSYISLRSYCPPRPSIPNPEIATIAMSGGGALFLLLFLIILLCPVRRKQHPSYTTTSTLHQTQSTEQIKSELVIFPDNNSPSWAKGLDVAGFMSWGSEVMGNSTGSMMMSTYKVELAPTDKVVVVKKLLDPDAIVFHKQDFAHKMDFLGKKIKSHQNVMPLRGYCIYKLETYLLIYDFFPAGSLYHRLHDTTTDPPLVLNWESRKKIALGAARGLAHLHTVVKLVHGNIKSSNIILRIHKQEENNFVVNDSCVADFGLTPTPPASYYGPVTRNAASFESDVYAFGVLLLELLTGKSPAAPDGTLPEWVQSLSGGETSRREIWDSKMDIGGIKMVKEMGCLLEIAKECTHQDANERPKMEKVALVIEKMNVKCISDEIECEGSRAETVLDQSVIHDQIILEDTSSLGTPPPPHHEIFEDSSSLGTPPPPHPPVLTP